MRIDPYSIVCHSCIHIYTGSFLQVNWRVSFNSSWGIFLRISWAIFLPFSLVSCQSLPVQVIDQIDSSVKGPCLWSLWCLAHPLPFRQCTTDITQTRSFRAYCHSLTSIQKFKDKSALYFRKQKYAIKFSRNVGLFSPSFCISTSIPRRTNSDVYLPKMQRIYT